MSDNNGISDMVAAIQKRINAENTATETPPAKSGEAVLIGAVTLLGIFVPGAIGLNYSAMIVGGVLALTGGLYLLGKAVSNRKNAK
jgi:hypothetical protein